MAEKPRDLRVLVVTPYFPHPTDHPLRNRSWHLLKELTKAADVTLLTWAPRALAAADFEAVSALADVISLPMDAVSRAPHRKLERELRFLATGMPGYVQGWLAERHLATAAQRRDLVERVRTRHAARPFDAVIFDEESMRAIPLDALGVPIVLHRLEAFGATLTEIRRASRSGRFFHHLDGWRWEQFDRRLMEGVALVAGSSQEVLDRLRPLVPAGVATVAVPNGVDLRRLHTPPEAGRDLAFVGTLDYPPNVDGICWFVDEVWPRLRDRAPRVRLRVIGRNPARAVRSRAGNGVDVVGEVPDVTDACDGVRVGVVPLRTGMGIKTKTLELLSMGLPVLSTSVGAEGVAAGRENGMIVADDVEGTVAAAVELLRSDELVSGMGQAAKEYVARKHSWEAIGRTYVEHLRALVAPARTPSTDLRAPGR